MVLGNYSSESQVKIDVYTEFNNDLENIWVKFEKDAVMTPFQSYAWLSHWQYMVGKPLFSVQPQIVHLHMEVIQLPFCQWVFVKYLACEFWSGLAYIKRIIWGH